MVQAKFVSMVNYGRKKNHKKRAVKDFIFEGFITRQPGDYESIELVDGRKAIHLGLKFVTIFNLFNTEVFADYFLCDEKTTQDKILKNWQAQISGGIDSDFNVSHRSYSEIRFQTFDSEFGGQDLINELAKHCGKWCLLKISNKKRMNGNSSF